MKAFVTGGTGFVGSHLVNTLLARGDEVTCLVRDPAKAQRVFPSDGPQIVRGSLEDVDALNRGCEGANVVFHVAGLTAARSRAHFQAVNAHATRALAGVARDVAPNLERFVYVSSLAAAGPTTKANPLTEAAQATPVSDYGWSKLAGEEAVRTSGLPWTILRPPTVYGPRDAEVLKLFRLARLGMAIFFGDGSQELSFIYGPDLGELIVRCVVPEAHNRILFACHPEIRTARAFATEIHHVVRRQATGRGPVTVAVPPALARAILTVTGTAARLARRATILNGDKANEFLADAWTCSSEAITKITGWSPPTDLATGLPDTYDWYKQNKWL